MMDGLVVQWLLVALIGIGAVLLLARHFGWGEKRAGCPGCRACAKPKRTGEDEPGLRA